MIPRIYRSVLAVMLLFFGIVAFAQLKVESFELTAADLTARVQPRYDRNGNLCAMIRVALPVEGCRFFGNVIDEAYEINEYNVYMSGGTKYLRIKCPGVETLDIRFSDVSPVESLESGSTYLLRLSGYRPENLSQSIEQRANYLVVNVEPKSAAGISVKVDGDRLPVEDGRAMAYVELGEHRYVVEADGYAAATGAVTVGKGDNTVVDVRLKSLMARLTVVSETEGADISVNGRNVGVGRWSGQLMPGLYRVEVAKQGYKPYNEEIRLLENDDKSIRTAALSPVYGALNVAYRPIGSSVYIDGAKVGETPKILYDIKEGTHSVRIEKKGYEPFEGTVLISEGKETLLEGALTESKGENRLSAAQQIPADPEVRTGTLPNGLTYYVRRNNDPAGRADFALSMKVGSVLEEDGQEGFTHFIEHMAFNGTKNFPGHSLVDWLGRNGVRFGTDLNAYTSFDEAVYSISRVPVSRHSMLDSCLTVLHDWSCAISFSPDDVEAEKGVVLQEYKMMSPYQKFMENVLPSLYPGSRYGRRLPVGSMDVVKNLSAKKIKDYYQTWFRPDLQAVIVVGDIDPGYIESKIKKLFSSIPAPFSPKERPFFEIPDNKETIVVSGRVKGLATPGISLYFKGDIFPRSQRNTPTYHVARYMCDVIGIMLKNRLESFGATMSFTDYCVSSELAALQMQMFGSDDDLKRNFPQALRAIERASAHGFTQDEYKKAMNQLWNEAESQRAVTNSQFVMKYARDFCYGLPSVSREVYLALIKTFSESVPVETVNEIFASMITDENRVALICVPEESSFTEEQCNSLVRFVTAEMKMGQK